MQLHLYPEYSTVVLAGSGRPERAGAPAAISSTARPEGLFEGKNFEESPLLLRRAQFEKVRALAPGPQG